MQESYFEAFYFESYILRHCKYKILSDLPERQKKPSEQLCFLFLGLVAGLLPLEVSALSVRRLKMSSAMLFSPQTMNTFDPTSQVCSLIQSHIQGGHKKSNINGPHGKKTSLSCIMPHYTLLYPIPGLSLIPQEFWEVGRKFHFSTWTLFMTLWAFVTYRMMLR